MALSYHIMSKEQAIPGPRSGEVHDLHLDLVGLKDNKPGHKLVVTFPNRQRGERAVKQMLRWCAEDGYDLYQSAIPGTATRQMYLEDEQAAG